MDSGVERDVEVVDATLQRPDTGGDKVDPNPCGEPAVSTGCSWDMPARADGGPVDPRAVAVSIRDADGGTTLLRHVDSASACQPDALEWYYELDDAGSPAHLVACANACRVIEASHLQVTVTPGCIDPGFGG